MAHLSYADKAETHHASFFYLIIIRKTAKWSNALLAINVSSAIGFPSFQYLESYKLALKYAEVE